MARASVFVHASRYETFGVVAAEALAAGLPVVATDSGGVTEILGAEPERLGALVAVDDSLALGNGILETLGRRETFDAATLRASVRSRFGAEVVAERLITLYAEVLSESAALSSLAPRARAGRAECDGPHRDRRTRSEKRGCAAGAAPSGAGRRRDAGDLA